MYIPDSEDINALKEVGANIGGSMGTSFISQLSQAQRLIPKQRGIEVVGSVPLIKGEKLFAGDNFGVGISLTRYLKRENYTFVGVEYEQQNMRTEVIT